MNINALRRKCCIKTNMNCFIMRPKSRHLTNVARIHAVIKRSKENATHQAPLPLGASQESSSSETYSTQISSPAVSYAKTGSDFPIPPGLYYGLVVFFLTVMAIRPVYEIYNFYKKDEPEKTSALKIQVGVLGTYRSLQKDLEQIAANTSKGLSYVLQEATLALLRHPDYCISGCSSGDVNDSDFECNRRFNRFSIEERSKFDVVSANNIRKKSATSQSFSSEYIVVTIVVVVKRVCELPPIKSIAQLKVTLQKLGCIPSRYIMKLEVFCNPQQENDRLTAQELLEDYPFLHPF